MAFSRNRSKYVKVILIGFHGHRTLIKARLEKVKYSLNHSFCSFMSDIKFSSSFFPFDGWIFVSYFFAQVFSTSYLLLGYSAFFKYQCLTILKLVSTVFYQVFIFSSNDWPSKTMKNVFYFI